MRVALRLDDAIELMKVGFCCDFARLRGNEVRVMRQRPDIRVLVRATILYETSV